jgi:hypothetical protein
LAGGGVKNFYTIIMNFTAYGLGPEYGRRMRGHFPVFLKKWKIFPLKNVESPAYVNTLICWCDPGNIRSYVSASWVGWRQPHFRRCGGDGFGSF